MKKGWERIQKNTASLFISVSLPFRHLNHPLSRRHVLKKPRHGKKKEEAQIHFYISMKKCWNNSEELSPPQNRINPLLFPLIPQTLWYYLIGWCTVWILSTKHAQNNVSRSPLWRLESACLFPQFISFTKCNASFFSVCPRLSGDLSSFLSSGFRSNYELTEELLVPFPLATARKANDFKIVQDKELKNKKERNMQNMYLYMHRAAKPAWSQLDKYLVCYICYFLLIFCPLFIWFRNELAMSIWQRKKKIKMKRLNFETN